MHFPSTGRNSFRINLRKLRIQLFVRMARLLNIYVRLIVQPIINKLFASEYLISTDGESFIYTTL